jgi:hypothetical protein
MNSRWREIALSILTLWSTLSIDLKALIQQHPNNTFSFNQQPFDQILNIITRSKHSSLDILINTHNPKSRELIGLDVCLIYSSRKSKRLYLQVHVSALH